MKKIIFKPAFFGLLFSFYFCAFLVYANIQKPRILVLHSYHKEYAWTRDVSIGIRRVLDDYSDFTIKWHYMDTKRRTSARYKETAAHAARALIERWEPHVIIAVDDNAQSLVVRKFLDIKDNPFQFVFSGVNAEPDKYGYIGANNVTGILERMALDAVKKMVSEIMQSRGIADTHVKIALITDLSPTSTLVNQEVQSFDWEPMTLSTVHPVETFDEWERAIQSANEIADILLFTNYHTITCTEKAKKVLKEYNKDISCTQKVPPQELIQWTMANTTLPNIGCWGFFVEDGGMAAIGVSAYEQGEVAAEMALKIIKDKVHAGTIPQKKTQQFIAYAREAQLEKVGYRLPGIYEAFARATNNYYID